MTRRQQIQPITLQKQPIQAPKTRTKSGPKLKLEKKKRLWKFDAFFLNANNDAKTTPAVKPKEKPTRPANPANNDDVALKPPALAKLGAEKRQKTKKLSDTDADAGKERIQKVLSAAGIASRREAERLVLEGRVSVNGLLVTELGTKVHPQNDAIKVNGRMILTDVEKVYAVFYKPKGIISSLKDPEGRETLERYFRHFRERLLPIGRLDFNSEGVLLMTNDGDLLNRIVKNRNLPKIYMVKVKGHPLKKDLDFLREGIFTDNGVVRILDLDVDHSLKNKSWIKLEVTQGSNLDLRELLNQRNIYVDRIVRSAVGNLSIKGLFPGEYELVKKSDFEALAISS